MLLYRSILRYTENTSDTMKPRNVIRRWYPKQRLVSDHFAWKCFPSVNVSFEIVCLENTIRAWHALSNYEQANQNSDA